MAASATAGALAGFGMRLGAPAAAFSAAGDRLRGLPVFVAPDRAFGASACVGLAQHAVLVVGWTLPFAFVAGRRGSRARIVAAVVVALLVVVTARVLPAPLALAAGTLGTAQDILVGVVLAASLEAGMRLAHPQSRRTRDVPILDRDTRGRDRT